MAFNPGVRITSLLERVGDVDRCSVPPLGHFHQPSARVRGLSLGAIVVPKPSASFIHADVSHFSDFFQVPPPAGPDR
jgi:hypothetical protein